MEFTESIKTCFSKYADFNGRASRSEYWWFWVFVTLVQTITSLMNPILCLICQLGLLLPMVAVGVRRMHDTNHSGWFLLVPIYNIILLVTPTKY